ncbi:MAG: ABC transporter substrate-binding protein [Candidatus Coatesbacteria bacterium]|nr:ABC transporter substrate-binding protein [Candidatus Coatesbacteria bacterium]
MRPGSLAAIALSICLLIGCGQDEPSPHPGSRLTIALQSDPTSLDPRLATDAMSSRVIDLLFNGLFKNDPNGSMQPDLLESYKRNSETSYLLKVKEGVLFSNGAELTSDDVKYTIESVMDPAFGSRKAAAFKNVSMVEIMDRYSLMVWLKEPQASFLECLKIGIVHKGEAEKAGDEFASRPVGTGPFTLVEWDKGSHIVLRRRDDYFEGAPRIEAIDCRIVPDTSTRLLELRKGSVEFVENDIPPELVEAFQGDAKFKVEMAPSSTFKYIGINMKHPILSRRDVRAAMAHAIDRNSIVDRLLLGQATLASGLLCPGNPFYLPDLKQYEFDPALARRMLDEAGLMVDAEKGCRFSITFKTSKDERANQIAQIIQQQLSDVGIQMEIKSYEWATFYSDIIGGNFDIYSLTWVGISDPDFFYDAFNSKSIPPNGVNRGHYSNPEIDRLTEQGRIELNPSVRLETYRQVQEIIAHDLPYIPLWYPHNVAIMSSRLKGFELYPSGDFKSFAKAELLPAQ